MNILVLGIGNAQVDLIRLLSKDHTIHTLSYSKEGRGLNPSDYFEKIDIKDEKAVGDYAKKHEIDLIYSVGSDLAITTSAKVSHDLKLPSFVAPEVVSICHNKHLLRAHLGDMPGNIKYKILHEPNDISGFEFPCIIKPVDSQGQRGVYLIKDKQELNDKFGTVLQFSEAKAAIAEQYIDGPEVSVNSYLMDGEIRFSIITDRIVWPEFPGGLIHKHRFPSQFTNEKSRASIHRLVDQVIGKTGIENGPVYFQIKLKNNEPKLIEVAPRLDGCHLWRLLQYATGIDLLKTTIRHLTGSDIENLPPEISDKTWILEFMCAAPQSKLHKDTYNLDNVHYYEWYYNEGETIRPINTYWEKCGYKIFST